MAEPTAAKMRGSGSNNSLPFGNSFGEMVPCMGAVRMTPAENPLKTSKILVVTRPARGPARRKMVPSASQGTLRTAPNMKKMRNDGSLHPRASPHHKENAARANRAMAIVQASSWGRRRRSQRSQVLRPKATAIRAEAAARAVFKVTGVKATGSPTEFVKPCTKQ